MWVFLKIKQYFLKQKLKELDNIKKVLGIHPIKSESTRLNIYLLNHLNLTRSISKLIQNKIQSISGFERANYYFNLLN